jgi:sterol desaturase/sphingolipid hydroxylase (fatty acid hydroxylase superfamily)
MITNEEQKFINYWKIKREQNKLNPFLFGKGFALGLLLSVLILICFNTGWYKRVAVNQLNPIVAMVAVLIISFFMAVFYNNFKHEQNEQLYKELLSKQRKSSH